MSLWPELASGEFTMSYVNAGGIRTRCLETGSGKDTLILLHGSGGHLEAYTRNVFAHGKHLAMQCHVEMTEAMIRLWCRQWSVGSVRSV